MNQQSYLYINALSDFGSRMNLIAVSALLFTYQHSPFWLMAYFLARQAGAILSSLFAGVLADRFDRRRCMLASDLICGSAIALTALFPHPLTAVSAAFVVGILYNVFQISFDASLAAWFGATNVYRTNSRIVRLSMLVNVLGYAASGLAADRWGYRCILAFDAATFLLSAYALTRMKWASKPSGQRLEPTKPKHEWAKAIVEAAAYIQREPFFLYLVLLGFLTAWGGAAWNYGLPLLSQADPLHQAGVHGLMWTAIGAGGVAGAYALPRFRLRLAPVCLAALGLSAVTISLAFLSGPLAVLLSFLFAVGFIDAGTQLYQRTLIQMSDSRLRGRVLGFQALLSRLGYLTGFLTAPFLLATFSLSGMVLVVQGSVLAIAALLARPFLHSARQTLPK